MAKVRVLGIHFWRLKNTYRLPATFVKGLTQLVELFNRDSHGLSKTRLATKRSKTKGGERKVSQSADDRRSSRSAHDEGRVQRVAAKVTALTRCKRRGIFSLGGERERRIKCGEGVKRQQLASRGR